MLTGIFKDYFIIKTIAQHNLIRSILTNWGLYSIMIHIINYYKKVKQGFGL